MNDLLVYVLESFFDSRQDMLNKLSKPETLKSKDVIDYIRSNMKGSKTKQGAFLREGPLYFLNAMVKEGVLWIVESPEQSLLAMLLRVEEESSVVCVATRPYAK